MKFILRIFSHQSIFLETAFTTLDPVFAKTQHSTIDSELTLCRVALERQCSLHLQHVHARTQNKDNRTSGEPHAGKQNHAKKKNKEAREPGRSRERERERVAGVKGDLPMLAAEGRPRPFFYDLSDRHLAWHRMTGRKEW